MSDFDNLKCELVNMNARLVELKSNPKFTKDDTDVEEYFKEMQKVANYDEIQDKYSHNAEVLIVIKDVKDFCDDLLSVTEEEFVADFKKLASNFERELVLLQIETTLISIPDFVLKLDDGSAETFIKVKRIFEMLKREMDSIHNQII